MVFRSALASVLVAILAPTTPSAANSLADRLGAASDLTDIRKVAEAVASYAYDYKSTDAMCNEIDKLTETYGDSAVFSSHHAQPKQCCVLRKQIYFPLAVIQLSTLLPWTPSLKISRKTEAVSLLAEEAMKIPEDRLKDSLTEAANWMSTSAGQACETGLRLFRPDKPMMPQ